MASEPCDGCGRNVKIAGGIANIWTFTGDGAGGLTLEFADGSDHLLCYDCIEQLPDDPCAEDVAALSDHEASG